VTFNPHHSIQLAESILASPPARVWVDRPPVLLFQRVAMRAAFPARLCLEANKMLRRGFSLHAWCKTKVSYELYLLLQCQLDLSTRLVWPIDKLVLHRPQVIAVKFAPRPTDVGANPAKMVIDMLTPKRCYNRAKNLWATKRIGIISDDRPEVVRQLHWCEFLPKAHEAFVLVEVRY